MPHPTDISAPPESEPGLPVSAAVGADEMAPEEEAAECPPPLMWRDVLSEVSAQSATWQVERAGARISGRTIGAGRPVYCLSATIGNWETFALLMWLLRDEFRVTVIDGIESTSARKLPWARLTADETARDLYAVADSVGDKRFCLFATSTQSLAAWAAMLSESERIERAVIVGGMAEVRLSTFERVLLFLGRGSGRSFSRLPFFERVQTHNHRRWFPPFDESRWQFLLDNIGATPVSEWSARLAGLRRSDLRARIAGIEQPVLLLRGEGEGQLGATRMTELRELLPAAEYELLPHCGRFAYLTHPHLLTKRIRTFFGNGSQQTRSS